MKLSDCKDEHLIGQQVRWNIYLQIANQIRSQFRLDIETIIYTTGIIISNQLSNHIHWVVVNQLLIPIKIQIEGLTNET